MHDDTIVASRLTSSDAPRASCIRNVHVETRFWLEINQNDSSEGN